MDLDFFKKEQDFKKKLKDNRGPDKALVEDLRYLERQIQETKRQWSEERQYEFEMLEAHEKTWFKRDDTAQPKT